MSFQCLDSTISYFSSAEADESDPKQPTARPQIHADRQDWNERAVS